MQWCLTAAGAMALCLMLPARAEAYVGPGAGFAVLSSFFVLLVTIVLALVAIVEWPFRLLWRAVARRNVSRTALGRLIVIGFDGQDPQLTDRFMDEGVLPHFARLARTGAYRRLTTTFPAVSPVAWSSFSTGTHPGRHSIFDFIARAQGTYLPRLSSVRLAPVERFVRVGRYLVPRHRPEVRLLRKSKPFWAILGDHGIWSAILRVPVTFPPDRFYGAQLSAMCVPDLLGTQGTFLLFTTRASAAPLSEGGTRVLVSEVQGRIETSIEGPPNPYVVGHPPLAVPLRIGVDRATSRACVELCGRSVTLEVGRLSDWVQVRFRAAPGITVRGLTRFQLLEAGDHVSLYAAPINLDPEKPSLPISHPPYYAAYLAKRIGPFATLGLAEDTWALNEQVTSEDTFLQQTCSIDRERRAMLFTALERLRRGALVCVFDATDRIQHMFWRHLDPAHPSHGCLPPSMHQDAIREVYTRNDALVGEVLEQLQPEDVLMVISDHGFSAFRRGVNINAWLRREGYLALAEGSDGTSEWLNNVDWSRTQAYCIGLTGLFLNLRGREPGGIVSPGREAARVRSELVQKLRGLVDPETGDVSVREAFDTATLYDGPYVENGPDILIGYNAGYRVSWECARGVVAGPVFQDNVKAWSGDHCIDPRLVPGVFFCNRPMPDPAPSLVDIAPTILRLFGIEPPAYMQGRPLGVSV